MTTLDELIAYARASGCSDVHLTAGFSPIVRRVGSLEPVAMQAEYTEPMIRSMLDPQRLERLNLGEDADFSYETPDQCRQRVNIYRERGRLCAAIRLLSSTVPTLDELQMPPILAKLAMEPRGLILVTGPTGSGKSTTLAAMIDYINTNRKTHIITIEDPIEYVYAQKQALIHQREVGADVQSFASSLRSALREDPDVILVGEMRDYETISAAVTAAETGHLVLSTLHTTGAANTIDRIVDVFPAHQQQQIRTQLSGVFKASITQQLVPLASGAGRIAAMEILVATDAVCSLIRDNKGHQLATSMQTGGKNGMQTMQASLAALVRSGLITYESAAERASDLSEFNQYLGR